MVGELLEPLLITSAEELTKGTSDVFDRLVRLEVLISWDSLLSRCCCCGSLSVVPASRIAIRQKTIILLGEPLKCLRSGEM